MKNSSRIAVALGVVFSLLTTAFAEPLPEELDYPKSKKIYDDANSRANGLRGEANTSLNTLNSIRSSISNNKTAKSNLLDETDDNTKEIAELRIENPRLQKEIENMRVEISSVQSRISGLQQQIDGLNRQHFQVNQQATQQHGELVNLDNAIRQDEANLAQFRQAYERDRVSYERASDRLDKIEHILRTGPVREQELRRSLEDLNSRIGQTEQRLNDANRRKAELSGRVQNLENTVNQERQRLQPIQERLNEANRQQQQAQGERNQAEQRVAAAHREHQAAWPPVERLRKGVEEAQSRLPGLNAETARWNHERNLKSQRETEIRSEMDDIKSRCPNIPVGCEPGEAQRFIDLQREGADVHREMLEAHNKAMAYDRDRQKMEDQLAEAGRDLPAAETRFQNAEAEVPRAEQARNDAQSRLDGANGNLQAARQNFESQSRELREAEGQLGNVRRELAQAEADEKGASERLGQLRRELPGIERDMAELRRELDRARNELDGARDQLRRARKELEESTRGVEVYQARLRDLDIQYRNLEALYRQTEAELVRLVSEINSRNATVSELMADVRDLQTTIADFEKRIPANVKRIASLETRNTQIVREIASIDAELTRLAASERTALTDYTRRDGLASNAESFAEQKRQEMLVVKNRFDILVAKAQDDGREQGKAGRAIGVKDGDVDGSSVGKKTGDAKGTEEGLAFGLEKGRTDGFNEGKTKGYQDGLNEPKNYDQGKTRGLIQGERDADAAAQSEFPKGMQSKREELLSTRLTQEINLDNLSSSGVPGDRIAKLFSSIEAGRMNDVVLANIEMDGAMKAFGLAPNAQNSCTYQGGEFTKPIKLGQAQCASHKYDEIQSACVASYNASYTAEYKAGYSGTYGGSYTNACLAEYDVLFERNKTVKYAQGHAETYGPTYAKFNAEGAKVAENKGFLDGKTEAYNSNIGPKKQHYFSEGQKEALAFFQANPVVRLGEVGVLKTSEGSAAIVAGDQLQIKLKLANFGQVGSSRGQVKAKIEALTPNAILASTQGWIDIVALPGQTISNVLNVAVVNIKSGIGAENVSLKVTVRLTDGETVEMPIQFRTVEHVSASLSTIDGGLGSKDSYLKPVVGKDQKVNVRIKNASVINPSEDLQVELSAVGENAGAVEFPRKTETISRKDFSPGDESGVLKLLYKVNSAAVIGKPITMVLKVKYKGNISLSTTFVATPSAK